MDTLVVGGDIESQDFYYLHDYVTVLPDSLGTLSLDDIKTHDRQSEFIPYHKEIMRETPGVSKYWHQLTIQNSHSTSLNFWYYSGATYSLLYDIDSAQGLTILAGGKNFSYDSRNKFLPQSIGIPRQLIPVNIEAKEVKSLYWYSTYPDFWKRYSASLAGYLVTDEYLQQRQVKVIGENYHFAFVIGIIVAITVFLFIFYSIYRDRAFFALAVLALSGLSWYLYNKGLLFTTLLASTSSTKTAAYEVGEVVFINLRVFAFYFYVVVFLKLKESARNWYQFFRWGTIILLGIINLGFILRFFILPHNFANHILFWQLTNAGIALLSIMYLVVGAHLSIKRVPMAGVYLLGNIFNITGVALHALSMNFISGPFLATIDQWGSALMLVTFSVALAYRMRSIESEKIQAETEVIQIDADLKAASELDTLKTSFFTSISHEFRTPLTLIMGPLEKMFDETSEQQKKGRLDLILRNAHRMQNLINQLLELAKINSNKVELQVSEHDFSKHIKTICSAHTSLAESNNIQFTSHTLAEEIPLHYDREMMNKLVNNLLSNAFKYCSTEGVVILSIIQRKAWVDLQIENSGEPIPLDDQEKMFKHFQRLETRHHQKEGSGIGLSLVKDYIDLHYGEILVRSEPEENITFTASFKVGSAHFNPEDLVDQANISNAFQVDGIESPAVENDYPDSDSDEDKPLVLVVEDNADMRQFICEELEDSYSMNTAIHGGVGLQAARKTIPDLIISDVMMPEMDGFTFLKESRKDPLLCHIPIIMLTALSTDESKFKGLETGADDYLLKPFNTRELRIRVANLIKQRERLRERFALDQAQDLKEVTVTSMDEKFLRGIMRSIESHIADMEFGVKELSEEVFMSRSQLFRKLTALTNLTPTDFIRTQRLKRAANLLEQHTATVTEIAYMVGFQNPAHFATSFKKEFGVSPSKYKESTD